MDIIAQVTKIVSPVEIEVTDSTRVYSIRLSGIFYTEDGDSKLELLSNLLLNQMVRVDRLDEGKGRVFFEGLNVNDFLLTRGYLLEDYS